MGAYLKIVYCPFRMMLRLIWAQRYLYSLVFAADMFRTVFKADPLDPAHGQLYRDRILRVGGGRDEIDMLRVTQFLVHLSRASLILMHRTF